MDFFNNEVFLIAITFVSFIGAQLLQRKLGLKLLNPILVSMIVLIVFLRSAGIEYDTYKEGGKFIEFWLKPAVVALGLPLYKQLSAIRKQILPLLISEMAGCVAGIVSVVLMAKFLGASHEVIMSLAPKAVTTPIAMEISGAVGGLPSLTAAVGYAPASSGAWQDFR